VLNAAITTMGCRTSCRTCSTAAGVCGLPADASLAEWRQRAQRALLLHVFLHDWHDDELTAFAWQSLPVSKAAKGNALADVQSLRRNEPAAYILHAFVKKTQKTPKQELAKASQCFK
jgi:hypothetical protein